MKVYTDPDTPLEATSSQSTFSFFNLLLLGFIFFVLALAGWVWYQNYQIQQRLRAEEKAIVGLKSSIETLTQKQQVVEKNTAYQVLERLESQRILWSEEIAKIFREIEAPSQVKITSLQATEGKSYSISGEGKDITDVARLLLTIKARPDFKNPFLMRLNKSAADKVGFLLTFDGTP